VYACRVCGLYQAGLVSHVLCVWFDVVIHLAAEAPFILTGTALGSVSAWQVDHLLPGFPSLKQALLELQILPDSVSELVLQYASSDIPLSAVDSRGIATITAQPDGPNDTSHASASESKSPAAAPLPAAPASASSTKTYRCRPLLLSADDGVRGIWTQRQRVVATIGSNMVYSWPSLYDDHMTTGNLQRGSFGYQPYRQYVVLQHGPAIVLVAPDVDSTTVRLINLATKQQDEVPSRACD